MPDKKIYLASASPRRRELLSVLLENFSIFAADIDETPVPEETPINYVKRMAREKAKVVHAQVSSQAAVIGGDTAVICEGQILGKPESLQDAKRMLRLLSGTTHQVVSAVAVMASGDDGLFEGVESSLTEVSFAKLSESWIDRYVDSREPMDKAGAYAIQGEAAAWIKSMHGSYSGVVGLPLYETRLLLQQASLLSW